MQKILFTGSSGFVSQNLKPYLEERQLKVCGLSLRGKWADNLPGNYDSIIHLAGKAHDTNNTADPEEYFQVNAELTKQLFNKFLQSPARDFIYFSSVKAVADTVEGVLDEYAVANPQTPYGQSKLKAEQYLFSRDIPAGKRVIIIRPCMIHGPGNKGNLNLLYKIVKKGIPWPLAAFENRRSFLSVDNLCFLITEILKNSAVPSGIYHCADDEALSTNELIALIARTIGKRPKLWHIPKGFMRTIAGAGDTFHLPLDSERLKKLTESYVVGNKKIKNALGLEQLPVSARDGLVKTIKSFE